MLPSLYDDNVIVLVVLGNCKHIWASRSHVGAEKGVGSGVTWEHVRTFLLHTLSVRPIPPGVVVDRRTSICMHDKIHSSPSVGWGACTPQERKHHFLCICHVPGTNIPGHVPTSADSLFSPPCTLTILFFFCKGYITYTVSAWLYNIMLRHDILSPILFFVNDLFRPSKN